MLLLKKLFHAILLIGTLCLASVVNAEEARISKTNKIKTLTLSTEKTKIISQKLYWYDGYVPEQVFIKVMATYVDGHSEEVTDRVTWLNIEGNITMFADYFEAKEGTYVLKASLEGVESNEIQVEIKNDTALIEYEISYDEIDYTKDYSYISIDLSLLHKPSHIVELKLQLRNKDKVRFAYNIQSGTKQQYTLTFNPEDWDKNNRGRQYQKIFLLDTTMTEDIVIVTEALQSEDKQYANKNPKDIIINRKPTLVLKEPGIQERRGGIRGVSILFAITTGKQYWTKVTLINPPKGMRIIKNPSTHMSPGATVQWDVPMDAIEGKIHHIRAKATDKLGREKSITFPIKVPITTAIETKIVNNELIVTDKSSNLYGMKMKGHSGEDISNLKLRAVAYEDVWKKKKVEKLKKHASFIVYNKPPQIDFNFPEFFSFHKHVPGQLLHSTTAWDNINRGYYEDNNGQFTIPVYREHDDGGNKVYFIYQSKKK